MSVMTPDLIFGEAQAGTTFAGTQYSRPLELTGASRCSFHLFHTGTATVTVTVWGTNVPTRERNDATDNEWTDLSAAPHSITVPNQPAGADSKSMTPLSDVPFQWIRQKYVTSGGTGTGKCWGKVTE